MKRLVLLSVVALMLASAVFAPVAMAQEPGQIDLQSVTLGPGGSVVIIGTIECVQGDFYQVDVTVRQRTGGNVFLIANGFDQGTCPDTGPLEFQFTEFGTVSGTEGAQRPFHGGRATVNTRGLLCLPDFSSCAFQQSVEEVLLR